MGPSSKPGLKKINNRLGRPQLNLNTILNLLRFSIFYEIFFSGPAKLLKHRKTVYYEIVHGGEGSLRILYADTKSLKIKILVPTAAGKGQNSQRKYMSAKGSVTAKQHDSISLTS